MPKNLKTLYTPERNQARREKMWREKSHNWKGNAASYSTVHLWLRKYHTKTSICFKCGEKKFTEWALRHGRKYTRNVKNYFELCRPCHRKYDKIGTKGWITKRLKDIQNAKIVV